MTSLLVDLEATKNVQCANENCEVKASLHKLPTNLNRGNFVYALLDDEYFAELSKRLKNQQLKDIIELGLLSN